MAETGNQRDLTKGEKTKYRLARAMKECMKTTSVENITVKQITEKCELTRQTFYRNFLDKYDLINWYFDKLLAKSFEHMGQGKTVYDALVKKFTYIQEEQKFFSAAFRYDEQNSLRQHDFELILAFYEKLICEKTGKFPEENVLFLLEMYCNSSIYMTVKWVTGEMTDMFHLKAIEIIGKSLRGAVENTKEGREGMALGQYIAGMGFSNVGLGIAHSMAHTLGAVYDTPHGVACAMTLPIVMEYNAGQTGEKYREIARAMGVKGVDDMSVEEYRKAAVDAVRKLSEDVGIPTKLEALKEEDLEFLAESAQADACAPGNPKDAGIEDFKTLFRKLM